MRLVGSRTILPLLPAISLALSCMASSPSTPERVGEAAPTAAAEQPAATPAPSETSELDNVAPEAPEASPPGAPPRAPMPDSTARSQSRLDIAVPSINGGLNRDIIRRIASDHADDIRDCHGRALASMPDLAGKLVVHVELDADGTVLEAKLGDDSSLHNRDVERCVLALIENWSFTDAGGKGSAELAFEF